MLSRRLLLATALLVLAGCVKEAPPKTYTVNGKVVLKNGNPYPGGSITFMSVANPDMRGYGKINKDGTFRLDSIAMFKNGTSQQVPGTIDGEFKVNIFPPPGGVAAATRANANNSTTDGDQANPPPAFGGPTSVGGFGRPFTLKKTYTIEPVDNYEVTVVVE